MKLKTLIQITMVCTSIIGFIMGLIISVRNYVKNQSACTTQEELNNLLKQSVLYFFAFAIFSVVSCIIVFIGLELFVLWILLVMAISIFL